MPIHVDGVLLHAMPDSELSRVRTEFDPLRIFPTVPPHPVHPNRESSGHGHLGDVPLPAQRQMQVPSPPVRIPTRCGLRCFSQQGTQKRAALLGDVSQPLMASTGVLARDQSDITADLLAALEPLRSSDDQHQGQRRDGSHARMRHQPQHLRPLPGFPLDSRG
jgi:hypothetical protein